MDEYVPTYVWNVEAEFDVKQLHEILEAMSYILYCDMIKQQFHYVVMFASNFNNYFDMISAFPH
jgi:hypothetical protein